MVGLFAIVAYSVSRRSGEIGIRVALGATRRAVMTLVIKDAVIIACLGCAIGLGTAWLITSPLSMFLVGGLSPTDPITFIGTTALTLAVSMLAAWMPARRATRDRSRGGVEGGVVDCPGDSGSIKSQAPSSKSQALPTPKLQWAV